MPRKPPKYKKGEYIPVPPVQHRFKPGQSGNPSGKPLNPISGILKEVTVQTYRDLIQLVLTGNVDQIKKIVADEKSPALLVGIAKCYVKAVDAGDWETIEKISQRIVGKIPEELNIKSLNANLSGELSKAVDINGKVKAVMDALEKEI